jgi:hypothetical protein
MPCRASGVPPSVLRTSAIVNYREREREREREANE